MSDLMFDKALGCFRGLAIGDALGAPVEFSQPGTFTPVTSYRPATFFGLNPGEWTDDTIMAVCMAEAMIEKNGYDSFHVMNSYVQWYKNGINSPKGTCFDIGNQISSSLDDFIDYPIMDKSTKTSSAGNGCIMRLAPASIVSLNLSDEDSLTLFKTSALDTHNNMEAIEATILYGFLTRGLLKGLSKKDAFDYAVEMIPRPRTKIADAVSSVNHHTVSNSGYVVVSFAAAWWSFITTQSFEEAVLRAVNLGGDADTIAAITGQLAGAFYGDESIDNTLKIGLYQSERFERLTKMLLNVENGVIRTRYENQLAIDY